MFSGNFWLGIYIWLIIIAYLPLLLLGVVILLIALRVRRSLDFNDPSAVKHHRRLIIIGVVLIILQPIVDLGGYTLVWRWQNNELNQAKAANYQNLTKSGVQVYLPQSSIASYTKGSSRKLLSAYTGNIDGGKSAFGAVRFDNGTSSFYDEISVGRNPLTSCPMLAWGTSTIPQQVTYITCTLTGSTPTNGRIYQLSGQELASKEGFPPGTTTIADPDSYYVVVFGNTLVEPDSGEYINSFTKTSASDTTLADSLTSVPTGAFKQPRSTSGYWPGIIQYISNAETPW